MNELDDMDDLQPGAYIPHDLFYISPTPIRLDALFYQVSRAGIVNATPPYFLIRRNESYMYNVIHCVTRGKGSVSVRGVTHSIQKGQLFLLPAYETHMYRSDPSDPLGLCWVEFTGGDSNRLSKYIFDNKGCAFSGDAFDAVLSFCTSILYRPTCNDEHTSQILYDMLIALCRGSKLEQAPRDDVTQQFLDYMETHLDERLTMAQMAAAFGYQPTYFSQKFTKCMGISFSQYMLRRRLRRACYLLMTTDWSLERIARELKFYDISHFTQRFKAMEGISPARYRRENGGTAFWTENAAPTR